MNLSPVEPRVRVRVPASSANLGPGFDSLGLALNIHNFVEVGPSAQEYDIVSAEGEGASVLAGEGAAVASNIALQAAHEALRELGAPPLALHLHLENHIPLARGLGSSSAARVGALVAANAWAKNCGWGELTPDALLNLATRLEGHPDNVAAALSGGLTASATGENGAFALRVPIEQFPQFLIFVPDSELETRAARAVLPDVVGREVATFNIARTALLLACLTSGDWTFLREALRDKLHQEHRAALMPGFDGVMRAATQAGALGATLSGAGPTILAWLPPEADAREVALAMQDVGAEREVFGRAQTVSVDEIGCVVV